MKTIKEILEKDINPIEKYDSTIECYVDEDSGIKYCVHCKTPLESEIDFLGKKRKVAILCDCKKDRRKREEQERQKIKKKPCLQEVNKR